MPACGVPFEINILTNRNLLVFFIENITDVFSAMEEVKEAILNNVFYHNHTTRRMQLLHLACKRSSLVALRWSDPANDH
jgi:hypothetical protein